METNTKMLVSMHCRQQNLGKPKYVRTPNPDGHGFFCTLTVDGESYTNVRPTSKKAAEFEAARLVCEKLCLVNVKAGLKEMKQQYDSHAKPVIVKPLPQKGICRFKANLLQVFAGSLNLQIPSYRFKESMEGADRKCTAVAIFEGKVFESRITSDAQPDSRDHAAAEALKYLGFKDILQADRIREHIGIQRQTYLNMAIRTQSPFSFCPSKRPSWVFSHCDPIEDISGEKITHKHDTLNIIKFKKSDLELSEKIFAQAMDVEPYLGDQKLSDMSDLCFGKINNEIKSKMIIGNERCSFPVFCKDGKIMCNKRKSEIEVQPGHKVCELKCKYELMYPSLRVYLKAQSCDDLVFPETPLSVVSSCGVVMLMHDPEAANTEDVHILLTRPLGRKTFATKVRFLVSYLRWLLYDKKNVNKVHKFTVAKCVEDITTWTYKEVQLMSEMTAESMNELFSLHMRYNKRWNEIFEKEHTDVLNELKIAAEVELARRTDLGVEEDNEPWSLPSTHFQHRLLSTGIYVENSPLCAFRSIISTTGLKIKLSDIEESPVIDLPKKDDANVHRDNVCQYYIWKGLRKLSGDHYYQRSSVLEKLEGNYEAGYFDTLNKNKRHKGKKRRKVMTETKRKRKRNDARKRKPMEKDQNPGEHVPEPLADGTTGECAELVVNDERSGENTTEPIEEDDTLHEPVEEDETPDEHVTEPVEEDETAGVHVKEEPMEEDGTLGENVTEPVEEDETPSFTGYPPAPEHVMHVHTECKWFPLEEAKLLCATLMELSKDPIFQEQVKALQIEANEVENIKTEAKAKELESTNTEAKAKAGYQD